MNTIKRNTYDFHTHNSLIKVRLLASPLISYFLHDSIADSVLYVSYVVCNA